MNERHSPFTLPPSLCTVLIVPVRSLPANAQFLLNDFTLDSITITPLQTTFAAGYDYMTDYDEWLNIQVGPTIDKNSLTKRGPSDTKQQWLSGRVGSGGVRSGRLRVQLLRTIVVQHTSHGRFSVVSIKGLHDNERLMQAVKPSHEFPLLVLGEGPLVSRRSKTNDMLLFIFTIGTAKIKKAAAANSPLPPNYL